MVKRVPKMRRGGGHAGGDEERDHRRAPRGAGGRRRGRRSRRRRRPNVCVVSWPLPAISTTSPAAASASARAMAARRSGSVRARAVHGAGDAGDHGRDDGSGVLASGGCPRSRPPRRRAGRRPRPSPAAWPDRGRRRTPNATITGRPGDLAGRGEHRREALGGVGEVDDHGERLAGVDRLEPPGHRTGARPARRRSRRAPRPSSAAAWPRPRRSRR